MHIPCAYLYFKRDTFLAENSSVQRLIHIVLRGGDIVLESVRQRLEHIVDKSEDVIALGDSGNDNSYGVLIVYLVDILVVYEYLTVDAVDTLYSSVDLRRLSKFL
jgi:hypothetical protein